MIHIAIAAANGIDYLLTYDCKQVTGLLKHSSRPVQRRSSSPKLLVRLHHSTIVHRAARPTSPRRSSRGLPYDARVL